MKTVVHFGLIWLLMAMFWACSDDSDEDTGPEVEPPQDVVVDTLIMGDTGSMTYDLEKGILYQYSAGYGSSTFAHILEMFSVDYDDQANTGDRLSFYFPTGTATSLEPGIYNVAEIENPDFVHADLVVGSKSFAQLGGKLSVEKTGEKFYFQWVLQGNRIGDWPVGSHQVYLTGSFDKDLDFQEVRW